MANDNNRLTDGQMEWSGGVSSDVVRTKAGALIPNGVAPNQLAWGINITVRGGGIGQRPVLQPIVQGAPWSGIFQGGMLYTPDFDDPTLHLLIGGRWWKIRVDTDNSVHDLSAQFGQVMPANEPHAYFAQQEMFGVCQIGDFKTLPLFYDSGVTGVRPEILRRSNGLVAPGVSNPNNEIPAAGPMDGFAQRLWYAFGRGYAAGDIEGNNFSGTAAYGYRDSVLKLTENPIAYGGDSFGVPTAAGNIRALAHASNLDTALGESNLFVMTRRAVYACSAPLTRDDWTAATRNQMPLQKVALRGGGTYGDRCVVPVNNDLFFLGPPDGGARSMQTAVRFYGSWGNVPLSNNINRLLAFNDRGLMKEATGVLFDNRVLLSQLPVQTPVGIGFRAIAPLDLDVISTFENRRPPAWEGVYDFGGGPYILQMFQGDFGGRERAFAVVWSTMHSQIEVWEWRGDLRFENGENRVERFIEFPAYNFNNPWELKELETGEIWFDKILGTIDVIVEYRPDSFACWQPWWAFQKCAAKDCREDPDNPCPDTGYPTEPWCEQDAIPVTLPKPPFPKCIPGSFRPANLGFQFQVRLRIKGWARVRGLVLHALPRGKPPFYGISSLCKPLNEVL